MKKEEAAALVVVLLTALIAYAPLDTFSQTAKPRVELSCYDTGEFHVRNLEDREKVFARIGKSWVPVSGDWKSEGDLKGFNSEEAVFLNPKGSRQSVRVGKSVYSVSCPGFAFSCKLINMTINACYKRNDTFYGRFTAYSFRYDKENEFRFENPFLMSYKVETGEGKEFTHAPQILSPEFKQIAMGMVKRVGSNRFTLRWNTSSEVEKFTVQYQNCDNRKYNFYDSFECTELPSCATDKGCEENEVCEDNLCIPISCGQCQYLEEHQCRDYECCGDGDCSSDYYCSGNQCLPLICGYDEVAEEHTCKELECEADEYIFNSSCVKLECGPNKVAKNHACADCSDDEIALNSNCEKLRCGFLKRARNHECISVFRVLFGK